MSDRKKEIAEWLDVNGDNFMGSGLTFHEFMAHGRIATYMASFGSQDREEQNRRLGFLIEAAALLKAITDCGERFGTKLMEGHLHDIIMGDFATIKSFVDYHDENLDEYRGVVCPPPVLQVLRGHASLLGESPGRRRGALLEGALTMKRPNPPMAEMPARWGKKRADAYAKLTEAYALCADEDVHRVLVSIAHFLYDTPRVSTQAVADAWAAVRDWNEQQRGPRHVECPVCGEFREPAIQGEVMHVHISRIVGRSADFVHIRSAGMQNFDFILRCLTCDYRWREGTPMIMSGEEEQVLHTAPADYNVN